MAGVLEWAAKSLERVDQAAKVVLQEGPPGGAATTLACAANSLAMHALL